MRHGGGTASVGAVVREDCAAGEEGDRGGGIGRDHDHSGELQADLFELDVQHPRLDDLAAVVVGAPDSGVALRQIAGM